MQSFCMTRPISVSMYVSSFIYLLYGHTSVEMTDLAQNKNSRNSGILGKNIPKFQEINNGPGGIAVTR